MLLSLTKKEILQCMGEPGGHSAKWNKSVTHRKILHSTSMAFSSQIHRIKDWLAKGREKWGATNPCLLSSSQARWVNLRDLLFNILPKVNNHVFCTLESVRRVGLTLGVFNKILLKLHV
jgi:hypothetical protein